MTISLVRVEATSWDVDNHDCEEELENLFQRYQDMLGWDWHHGTYGLYLISRVSAEAYTLQGNKGGTAIRMTYSPPLPSKRLSVPTTITFVNSHLAAFDEMTDRRNAEFHDLSRRMLFQYSTRVEGNEGPSTTAYPINVSLFETDVLFWMVRTDTRLCRCFN